MEVFLDASVIIAGLYSLSGGSAVILKLIEKDKIKGATSQTVAGEVQRNISQKLPEIREKFAQILASRKMIILPQPAKEKVLKWYHVIDPKDAHVLASCVASKADYLVTLDRKHFMLPNVQKAVPFKIVTPKELIGILDR